MKNKIFFSILLTGLSVLLLLSCKKDDSPAATVVKQWTVNLSAKNENPAPTGRNETGTVALTLLSDNSLTYTITINGLAAGDAIVAAHLHVGDVITNGPIILPLSPTFSGGTGTGSTANLRSTLVDSLKNDANEIYFNVHSTQVGSGLARGQLNTNLEMVAEVLLSGANEIPATSTTATGLASFRLTSAKKLYAKFVINNLESGDAFKFSHIHTGAAGTNGPVYLGIYGTPAEFGTVKIIPVTDEQIAVLKTQALYANAHSNTFPAGIVRGQIR